MLENHKVGSKAWRQRRESGSANTLTGPERSLTLPCLPDHRHPKQKAEREQRRSLTLTGRPSDDPAETGNRKCDL